MVQRPKPPHSAWRPYWSGCRPPAVEQLSCDRNRTAELCSRLRLRKPFFPAFTDVRKGAKYFVHNGPPSDHDGLAFGDCGSCFRRCSLARGGAAHGVSRPRETRFLEKVDCFRAALIDQRTQRGPEVPQRQPSRSPFACLAESSCRRAAGQGRAERVHRQSLDAVVRRLYGQSGRRRETQSGAGVKRPLSGSTVREVDSPAHCVDARCCSAFSSFR
jgi:hypothetical protein